jgi:hypothetical protein
MKEVLKATNTHINRFLKAARNCLKKCAKNYKLCGFQKQFIIGISGF